MHVGVGGRVDVAIGFGVAIGTCMGTISVGPAVLVGAFGVVGVALMVVVGAVVLVASAAIVAASSTSWLLVFVVELVL